MFGTLVDVANVRAHLGDANWVIVDCRHDPPGGDPRAGRRAYEEAHVPRALYADVDHDMASPPSGTNGRHPLPDPQTFAQLLRSYGVRPESQIVAYDAGADMMAARFWFLCRWIGHASVAVMDGGFPAWIAAGGPTEAGRTPFPGDGTIVPTTQDDLVAGVAEVLAATEKQTPAIVDARSPDRFAGRNETIDPVAGHIPGARNRFFKDNFTAEGRYKSAAELWSHFTERGWDRTPVIHQCGSGVSAAVNLLAMEHAGLTGSRLYPGSWSEWISDPSRPIARDE